MFFPGGCEYLYFLSPFFLLPGEGLYLLCTCVLLDTTCFIQDCAGFVVMYTCTPNMFMKVHGSHQCLNMRFCLENMGHMIASRWAYDLPLTFPAQFGME